MSTYSVADAKSGLPRLINRAMAGEKVIITRHGKAVAELRSATSAPDPKAAKAAFERLVAARVTLAPGAPNSVELLNMIYDDPGV